MKCADTVPSLHNKAAVCLYAWNVQTQFPHYTRKQLAVSMHEVCRHSSLTTQRSSWMSLCMKCADTVPSLHNEAAGCLYAWSVQTHFPHYTMKQLAVPNEAASSLFTQYMNPLPRCRTRHFGLSQSAMRISWYKSYFLTTVDPQVSAQQTQTIFAVGSSDPWKRLNKAVSWHEGYRIIIHRHWVMKNDR